MAWAALKGLYTVLKGIAAVGAVVLVGIGLWRANNEWYWSSYPPSPKRAWGELGTRSDFFDDWSCEDRVGWVRDRLGDYGLEPDDLVAVAKSAGVPPRLLATVIVNELSDYDMKDHLQEWGRVAPESLPAKIAGQKGEGSYGIAQLQPDRVLRHGLVEIVEDEVRAAWRLRPGAPPYQPRPDLDAATLSGLVTSVDQHRFQVMEDITTYYLLQPRAAVAIAAAEIRYILGQLEAWRRQELPPPLVDLALEGPITDSSRPHLAARAHPHPDLEDLGPMALREAALTYAVVVEYNSPGKTPAIEPKAGVYFRENFPKDEDRFNAEIHAINATRLWLHCFVRTGFPGSEPDGPTFFGVGSHGRYLAYVVDRSSSMSSDGRMTAAVDELVSAARELPGGSWFRVLFFSSGVERPPADRAPEGWVSAGTAEAGAVLDWARTVRPGGETRPLAAFEELLGARPLPDVIFFLTDGELPDGTASAIGALNRRTPKPAVIHAVGLGDDAKVDQLQAIAAESGGRFTRAR